MGKKATFYLIDVIIMVLTVIFSILTIVGRFTAFVEPNSNSFLTLLGLFLIPLLIVDFVLFIYWIIRRKLFLIVPFIAILFNFSFLSSVFRISFKSNEPKAYDLKVASYNVHSFCAYSLEYTVEAIADYFEKEKVDVVCFQEFSESQKYNMDSIRKAFSYLNYYSAPLNKDQKRDLVVFSKFPISDVKLFTFDYTNNSFMHVNLNVNGHDLLLVNAHLQTTSISQSRNEFAVVMDGELSEKTKNAIDVLSDRLIGNYNRRAEQVKDICNIVENSKIPVIVCGDFNDIPSSYVYNRMIKSGLNDGFRSAGSGYTYTFRQYYKTLRIDYIFHSKAMTGVDYYSDPIDLSDHLPVIMELNINF